MPASFYQARQVDFYSTIQRRIKIPEKNSTQLSLSGQIPNKFHSFVSKKSRDNSRYEDGRAGSNGHSAISRDTTP
jgi:hypothetical protein